MAALRKLILRALGLSGWQAGRLDYEGIPAWGFDSCIVAITCNGEVPRDFFGLKFD